MRQPRDLIDKPWANYLRQKRLQTRIRSSRYRGAWPMSQAAFAAWLAKEAGIELAAITYITWENGTRTPKDETMDTIRSVLELTPLPFEEELEDAPVKRPRRPRPGTRKKKGRNHAASDKKA